MVDSIKGVSIPPPPFSGLKPAGEPGPKDGFGSVLKDSIDNVNRLQQDADKAIDGLVKGENKNIHDTMIAVEKANLSFNLMIQVRNKILAAYEEIMRMQV